MARRIIIPARYGSTRLPEKLLLPIADKPLIVHTYLRALACGFDSVVVATDDERIAKVVRMVGAEVCMTRIEHPAGTDRCAEAATLLGYADDDIIVNVQGDEPLLPVANVLQVADNLDKYAHVQIATLCDPIDDKLQIFNPHAVKVVFNAQQEALYFSRAPIPWARNDFPGELSEELFFFRHVGIYAYRSGFLKQYPNLNKSPLERLESLEQLRALWHGYKIHVDIAVEHTPPGVDTASNFQEVKAILEKQ